MKYLQYAQDVISGKIIAGEFVKLACERFYDLMDNENYEFRESSVQLVIDFFLFLNITLGVMQVLRLFCNRGRSLLLPVYMDST